MLGIYYNVFLLWIDNLHFEFYLNRYLEEQFFSSVMFYFDFSDIIYLRIIFGLAVISRLLEMTGVMHALENLGVKVSFIDVDY